jgi:hypothetical protein
MNREGGAASLAARAAASNRRHEDFRQHGRTTWLLWRFVGGVALAVHTSENFLPAKHLMDCSRRARTRLILGQPANRGGGGQGCQARRGRRSTNSWRAGLINFASRTSRAYPSCAGCSGGGSTVFSMECSPASECPRAPAAEPGTPRADHQPFGYAERLMADNSVRLRRRLVTRT